MRYLCIILFFILLTACNNKKHKSITENVMNKKDSIFVTYYCGSMDSNVAIRCEKLAAIQERHPKNQYGYIIPEELKEAYEKDSSVLDGIELEYFLPVLIDTFIVDKSIIDRIVELVEKRTPAPDFSGDARMYVTIKNGNEKFDYLCFDNFPNQVKCNGKACLIDKELSFLLRYYSGYYSWFSTSDLDWFEELKNNTEFRQKVIEQIKLREEIFPRAK